MKDATLLKVVGTSIRGESTARLQTTIGRGITRLRRGQSILDFVTTFLQERGVSSFTLNERDNGTWATSPLMFLTDTPKLVLTYTFTQFPMSELGFHIKDLTPEERARDLKLLKKVLT